MTNYLKKSLGKNLNGELNIMILTKFIGQLVMGYMLCYVW